MSLSSWLKSWRGQSAQPSPHAAPEPSSLAEEVGKNWKKSGYFDRAEGGMDKQWERV